MSQLSIRQGLGTQTQVYNMAGNEGGVNAATDGDSSPHLMLWQCKQPCTTAPLAITGTGFRCSLSLHVQIQTVNGLHLSSCGGSCRESDYTKSSQTYSSS